MSKKLLLSLLVLVNFYFAKAQTGGKSVYSFLKLPVSARVSALGGSLISVNDDDVNNGYNNPALLNSSMHNHASLSAASLFAGARYGSAIYAYHDKKLGTMSAGILFSDYGKFEYTDPYADSDGRAFYAADYNLILAWAKPIDSLFSIGVNLKTLMSVYEIYRSVGLAADIGFAYTSKDKSFTSAMVMKNAGRQLKPFVEGNIESLPFDIQFGMSKKFAHVPFRFFLTADHLLKYDLSYYAGSNAGSTNPIIGSKPEAQDSTTLDKTLHYADRIMRHVVLGGEMNLTKSFHIMIGYNYLRRKELGLDSKMGMSGFSWGFGFNSSKFSLVFGRASYHQAGATNNLTVNLKISEFRKKN